MIEDEIRRLQDRILQDYSQLYPERPLTAAVLDAFRQTPRHHFVKRYRVRGTDEWKDVTPERVADHLPTLYGDHPLYLFEENAGDQVSTISQPTLVLYMLELLQIESGQRVCEIGAGSGWNAALLGRLVGPKGRAVSVDIIPEMAKSAQERISDLSIPNVNVVLADGGGGYEAEAPYDRFVFTVGTYDIPTTLYGQVREGGFLLVVLKNRVGSDTLYLMRKVDNHFESVHAMSCGFVSLTGDYRPETWEPVDLESHPDWSRLRRRLTDRRPFWWGGQSQQSFLWKTTGIRSFLSIAEPGFELFSDSEDEEPFFGVFEGEAESLVLARDGELTTYGTDSARHRLMKRIHEWVDLGMPSGGCFSVKAYPGDGEFIAASDEWVSKREHSIYVWRLNKR